MNYSSEQLKKVDVDTILHPMSSIAELQQMGPDVIVSGNGCYLTDCDGKDYLSCDAGLGATTLGFGQKRLAHAMYNTCEQLGFYQTTLTSSNKPQILLAEKLLSYVPDYFSKVFFANSGSEANETALKISKFFNVIRGKPEKKKIISRGLSYHGSTMSTVGVSGIKDFHLGYNINRDDTIYLSCPHYFNFSKEDESEQEFTLRLTNELRTAIAEVGSENIAAYIAEPIMGCAGVLEPPVDYFPQVQSILKENDILFICDEVLCGYGRTGNFFGYECYGIEPDIITSAKGLTSGYFPMSAVFISHKIIDLIAKSYNNAGIFAHVFTSSGHPVGASVALETLAQLEELNVLENVRQRGQQLKSLLTKGLESHPNVGDIRGEGLMLGVQIVQDRLGNKRFSDQASPVAAIESACKKEGLLVRHSSTTQSLFFLPPLVISEQEINDAVKYFISAINIVLPTGACH